MVLEPYFQSSQASCPYFANLLNTTTLRHPVALAALFTLRCFIARRLVSLLDRSRPAVPSLIFVLEESVHTIVRPLRDLTRSLPTAAFLLLSTTATQIHSRRFHLRFTMVQIHSRRVHCSDLFEQPRFNDRCSNLTIFYSVSCPSNSDLTTVDQI